MAAGQKRVALVTGATGLVGRYVVMQLAKGDWHVIALSRKDSLQYEEYPNGLPKNVHAVKCNDQTSRDEVDRSLGARVEALGDTGAAVTHVFHCAYITFGDEYEDTVKNKLMLQNVVEVCEQQGAKLQHVYCQSGSKWYGQHLGMYPTPAYEDQPRAPGPQFYYAMEDWLRSRADAGASWTWSTLRPNPVIGYSPKSYMNLLNCIGAYAALCTRLNQPFRFPGSDAAYNAVFEACDADLLAEAIEYCATHEETANQSFNVSNGDVFRWNQVWPRIAEHFGLVVAPPLAISLTNIMVTQEKVEAWQGLVEEHGLRNAARDLEKLAAWGFGDFCFSKNWDVFQTVQKLRKAGFAMNRDTGEQFIRYLEHLVYLKIIPPLHSGGSRVGPSGVVLSGQAAKIGAAAPGAGKSGGQAGKVPAPAEAPAGMQSLVS